MTKTFERRQRILNLLQAQKSLTVTELAHTLDVSESTIRNDLTTLDQSQQLVRVRGGAVLKENAQPLPPDPRESDNHAATKQRIARWAAEMVEDGDSILLDASNTVYYMASFLRDRCDLTIVTNGIEVARVLAKNSSNTVILVGGILRPNGDSITGYLGEKLLKDLHIKTAFVTCSGLSLDIGLTEMDLQEAQLKTKMIHSADQVIALIDSSKFGQARLIPFAGLDQIAHIVTDSDIEPQFVEQLRQKELSLTVCGPNTVSSYNRLDTQLGHYKVGFANLSEDIPFAVDVRRSLERAAKKAGNIDLIAGDNRLSSETAVKIADRLIEKQVDLVIEFQIDQKVGNSLMNRYQEAQIPVIAVDIPMVGANFFGVDNYRSGYMAGKALGNWIREQWQGQVDRLFVLEESRAGDLPAARIQGQVEAVQDVIGEIPAAKIVYLDSGNTSERSEIEVTRALKKFPEEHRIAVISFNDDAAFGALTAARNLGREEDLVIVGQGADRKVRPEIRRPDSRIIGSTAFMPEKYGDNLMAIAQKILRGEAVPPATYIDHTFIDAGNVDLFYPE